MFSLMCRCEKGHPPGFIPLTPDPAGETLPNEDGVADTIVEECLAFVDLLIKGRWSGLVTSDKMRMDTMGCPAMRR